MQRLSASSDDDIGDIPLRTRGDYLRAGDTLFALLDRFETLSPQEMQTAIALATAIGECPPSVYRSSLARGRT